MAKQDDYARYTIRVPKDLYDSLERAAHEANRSVNSEIVERLAFAMTNSPEMIAELKQEIEDIEAEIAIMESDLRSQAEDLLKLQKYNNDLKITAESNTESQKSLLYHVLNYIEDIPPELAIWAFDMTKIIERENASVNHEQQAGISEQEALNNIIKARDKFKSKALRAIKRHLARDRNGNDNI